LGDSLQGKSITTILITASKKAENMNDTLTSLDFGKEASQVKMKVALDAT